MGLLALFGYVPWLLALKRSSIRQAFWLSLLAATIQYYIILYWIYIPLHDYGFVHPALSILITFLLALLMGLKNGLFFAIARHISIRSNYSIFLVAPLALTTLEYVRNYYIFGGFPWGNVGYSIGRIPEFLQTASLFGVYGLVFIVGISNSLLSYLIDEWIDKKIFLYKIFISFCLVILIFYSYGFFRIKLNNNLADKTIKVAIMQGNIPQSIKQSARMHADEILKIYFDLNKKAIEKGAELVIWPESAYPRVVDQDLGNFEFPLDQIIPSVIGVTAFGFDDPSQSKYHYHNAAFIVDAKNNIKARYDKSHLVPFGEYVPWPMHGIVEKLVGGMGSFLPGTKYEPYDLNLREGKKILLGTTICYEGIFPEISRAYSKNKTEILLNLTNDAWYGYSSAPFQHLLMYRMRAAETGIPFLRATNSGISAIIDRFGNIKSTLGLNKKGILIDNIDIIKTSTVYTKIGDILPIFIVLIFLLSFLVFSIPFKNLRKNPPWPRLIFSLLLLLLAIYAQIYYSKSVFMTDESAKTKGLLILVYCFIAILGLLSHTARVRQALIISGMFLGISSLVFGILENKYFLIGSLMGILLYIWGLRKKVV